MDTDVAVLVVDRDEAEGREPGVSEVIAIDEVTVGGRELAVSLVGGVVGVDDEAGGKGAVPDAGEGDVVVGAFLPQRNELAEALRPPSRRRHRRIVGREVVADADEFVHLLGFERKSGVLEPGCVRTRADGQ